MCDKYRFIYIIRLLTLSAFTISTAQYIHEHIYCIKHIVFVCAMWVCVRALRVCAYICIHKRKHTYTYTGIHTGTHTHIHTYTHTHAYKSSHTQTYTHTHTAIGQGYIVILEKFVIYIKLI